MKYDFKRLIDETAWVEEPFMRKYRCEDYPKFVEEFEKSDSEMLVKNPDVSVCVLVYNKKPYLRECVNSILRQDTSFSFEIILAEDSSTDGSRELCFELQRAHPDKIRVVYASANVGVMKNMLRGLGRCRGRFAACVDGDDYYVSRQKLQSHAEYLAGNPDCALVYSAVYTQYEKHNWFRTPNSISAKRDRVAFERLDLSEMSRTILRRNPIAAVSPVFRMSAARLACRRIEGLYQTVDWFPCQDFELWFYIATTGRVHYIARDMVAYRLNKGAVTAADMRGSCARVLGDVRNKLAIICDMGEGFFSEADQDFFVGAFLNSLQELFAVSGVRNEQMPYVTSLCGKLLSEEELVKVAKRLQNDRAVWEKQRSPKYFALKKLVLEAQNRILRS